MDEFLELFIRCIDAEDRSCWYESGNDAKLAALEAMQSVAERMRLELKEKDHG